MSTLDEALKGLGLSPEVQAQFFAMKLNPKAEKAQLKWLTTLSRVVDEVIIKMKRDEIRGSGLCAVQTCELLRTIISRGKFSNMQMLLSIIKAVGARLVKARPTELAIGNMVRRVLYMVRTECAQAQQPDTTEQPTTAESEYDRAASDMLPPTTLTAQHTAPMPESSSVSPPLTTLSMLGRSMSSRNTLARTESTLGLSLANLLDKKDSTVEKSKTEALNPGIKNLVIEEICELVDEIKSVSDSLRDQAEDHVHAKDVIITFGVSKTVVAFLTAAHQFRQFEVIVCQSAPGMEGNAQAAMLAKAGIKCTVIPDAAVFAVMSHASKVIIGTHAVLANGGLLAFTGAYNLCLAAHTHAVPILVLTGLHKLSPLYAFDEDTFNVQHPPSQILPFDDACTLTDSLTIMNPAFDYVPPELITLFVTNNGGHAPFYIYRLLSEFYSPLDYEL